MVFVSLLVAPILSVGSFAEGDLVQVDATELRMRSVGSTDGRVLGVVDDNERGTVLAVGDLQTIGGETSRWVRVRMADGDVGWLWGVYLDMVRRAQVVEQMLPRSAGFATIDATLLNIRSGPSTGHEVVARASDGDIVEVLQHASETVVINGVRTRWVRIRSVDQVGWVAGMFLQPAAASDYDQFVQARMTSLVSRFQANNARYQRPRWVESFQRELYDFFPLEHLFHWDGRSAGGPSSLVVMGQVHDGDTVRYLLHQPEEQGGFWIRFRADSVSFQSLDQEHELVILANPIEAGQSWQANHELTATIAEDTDCYGESSQDPCLTVNFRSSFGGQFSLEFARGEGLRRIADTAARRWMRELGLPESWQSSRALTAQQLVQGTWQEPGRNGSSLRIASDGQAYFQPKGSQANERGGLLEVEGQVVRLVSLAESGQRDRRPTVREWTLVHDGESWLLRSRSGDLWQRMEPVARTSALFD